MLQKKYPDLNELEWSKIKCLALLAGFAVTGIHTAVRSSLSLATEVDNNSWAPCVLSCLIYFCFAAQLLYLFP